MWDSGKTSYWPGEMTGTVRSGGLIQERVLGSLKIEKFDLYRPGARTFRIYYLSRWRS